MFQKMNKYVWILVCTITLFVFSPKRSRDPLGAAIIAVGSGALMLLVLLLYDFVLKPIFAKFWKPRDESLNAKYPQLLLAAADGDIPRIEALIAERMYVDVLGPNGETALMLAARNGKIDAFNALLSNGADPTISTPKGSTALSIAHHFRHGEIERILSEKMLFTQHKTM